MVSHNKSGGKETGLIADCSRPISRFFTRADHFALLQHCPCQEWRTILTLARYGGVRCPCELLQLRWSDIDWNGKRMSVPNPKWSNSPSGRLVPLFPEVRRELQLLFDLCHDKKFVINLFPNRRKPRLATQFVKIASAAGIEHRGRPLLDMRSSRFCELIAKFGNFYASIWLGVEPQGNEKFLFRIPDQIIQQAANWEGGT